MTDTTVPLDVDAIRARVEAATEHLGHIGYRSVFAPVIEVDVPALLDEVDRLRSLLGEEEWEYGVARTHNGSFWGEWVYATTDLEFIRSDVADWQKEIDEDLKEDSDPVVLLRRTKAVDAGPWVVVPHE